jgi:serpin B
MRKPAYLQTLLCAVLLLTTISGTALAQGDTSKMKTLVQGNTRFAFKLYHTIGDGNTKANLIYSPYSISEAFAMVYAGAKGDTEKTMSTVLDYSLPQAEVAATFKLLNDDIVSRGNHEADAGDPSDQPRALNIANGIWVEKNFPVKPAYQQQMGTAFGVGLQPANFSGAPEVERQKINEWIAYETNDRIKDIIPPGALNEGTRMVLANAIYFMNAWQHPFGEAATQPDAFFLLDGTSIQVPMMVHDSANHLPYFQDADADLVELPYLGAGMSMVIVMPASGKFADFEKSLDAQKFTDLMDKLSKTQGQQIRVHMPRYKFEYSQDLTELLKTLGMGPAFTSADFSGISDEGLSISKAIHKAFIAVDEKGTEAAAATVIIMVTSAQQDPPPVLDVKIDRPFIFFIRDQNTGSILFMGRILKPSEE